MKVARAVWSCRNSYLDKYILGIGKDGSSGSGVVTPQPTSMQIINSDGTHTGSLTLTTEGASNVTYGPTLLQRRTVTGNLTIDGTASGIITLRNITVNGNLIVNTPNATVTLDSSVTMLGTTIIKDVSVGTFNTEANHDGKVLIQDSNGGAVNFTGSTISEGIEINPTEQGIQPILIRGNKPTVAVGGNADIKITGNSKPKVVLEGEANKVLIEAENSEFEISDTGDADKITISNLAAGSKIKTSSYYEFELLFEENDTVAAITNSGLFGDEQIRVVGYPLETESIKDTYILKIDTPQLSVVYTLELDQTLIEGQDSVQKKYR